MPDVHCGICLIVPELTHRFSFALVYALWRCLFSGAGGTAALPFSEVGMQAYVFAPLFFST